MNDCLEAFRAEVAGALGDPGPIEADGKIDHVFTYKRTIDGQVVEIETGLSAADFARLWTQRIESLQKVR